MDTLRKQNVLKINVIGVKSAYPNSNDKAMTALTTSEKRWRWVSVCRLDILIISNGNPNELTYTTSFMVDCETSLESFTILLLEKEEASSTL